MNARMVLSAIWLSLAITGANGQTTEPAKTPPAAEQPKAAAPAPAAQRPARETPPDQKAYQEANRITDPAKKIEALEKFRKDFPDSTMASSARMNILSTMAKMPDQKERIQAFARSMYQSEKDKKKKVSMAGQMADTLLTNNVLLKDAEKYARISLKAMDQASYLKEQKASYEKRKATAPNLKIPSDADLIQRFKESRATRVATLGRIEYKLGRTKDAQKLLEESYGVNANQPVVAGALGEIAAKAGNDAKALDYLIPARLSGRAPSTANEALDAVYRKKHNGSLEGLDAMLDAEYHKRFPNPLHLDAYKPTEKRSDRLVLAEVFTGSGCPPCVGADLAFESASERYGKNLAVVMYHQHIPQPDPMTNPDTQARFKSYEVQLAVPTYVIDGKVLAAGGGGRENTKSIFERFQKPLEEDLEKPAEAKLNVHAGISGKIVTVEAAVSDVKGDSPDLKVHVLLLEKELKYSGENGIRFHPMVVRAMGGKDDDGFALAPGGPLTFDQTWDLDKVSAGLKAHLDDYEAKGHRGNSFKFIEKKYPIDRAGLAVVVLVQDAKTKHILQSAFVDLNPQAPHIPTDNSASK